ncbi:MAG TPA: hypothetical protein VI912_00550 [Candidatus Bilamarchaeaceae archaeon]|nr:hypothetical protein [Candidatus Bilamarchaeaceae archaeon]
MGFVYLENFDANALWYVIVILASMVSVIIHAAIMAFAKGFHLEELERYAKSEILQVFATVFILLFLAFILDNTLDNFVIDRFFSHDASGAAAISIVQCGGESIEIDSISSSLDVVRCRISQNAEKIHQVHINAYAENAAWWDTFGTSFSVMGVPVFQGSWFEKFYKSIEVVRFQNLITTEILIASNVMIDLVNYAKNNMLGLFLPIGVLLRGFYFSRGIGAFFISLGLGFYYIFPVIFTLTDPGLVVITLPQGGPELPDSQKSCYPTFSGVALALSESPEAEQNANVMSAALQSTSKYYSDVIVRMLTNFSITLIFVRYLMYLLGGEPYTLMRMVAKVM